MKKILISIFLTALLVGCNYEQNKNVDNSGPFKEYSIKDNKFANEIENGILKVESERYGLNLETSSAHLISLKKIGDYASGEIRIIGFLTPEGIERVQDAGYVNVNRIVTFTCKFEYSYKTNNYIWTSDFPYLSDAALF